MILYRSYAAANHNGLNRFTKAQFTVVQMLDQTSFPENGLLSFSGVLFGFFFAQTKKNNKNYLLSNYK
jgi:hypothetical protein